MRDWKGNYCWQALQDSKMDGKSGKIIDVATFKIDRVIIKNDPVSFKSDPLSFKSDPCDSSDIRPWNQVIKSSAPRKTIPVDLP